MSNIRNFCIIAHIDHGKSTLADRFLELTGTVDKREMKEQLLDQMDLERERGITIKLQPVRMIYHPQILNPKSEIINKSQIHNSNNQTDELKIKNSKLKIDSEYILNLIDTPGHVDFSYEVSRSLAAVEGAILLVDATQGVQAQTLANLYQALDQNLTIIPVLNKIDLPNSDVDKCKKELVELLGFKEEEILAVSAKTGEGVLKILDEVINKVPPPIGDQESPTQALVFDSVYDNYRGVVAYVRVVNGIINKNDKIKLLATNATDLALELGTFSPKLMPKDYLTVGEIGYIVTGFRSVEECKVGDTVTTQNHTEFKNNTEPHGISKVVPLKGYKKVVPMVFASVYTVDGEVNKLRDALGKLKLNDASLNYEPENSGAFGFGFKCGFLGLLHMEIVKERLEREYGLSLVITTPKVNYIEEIKNSKSEFQEPWSKVEVISPQEYLGAIMDLFDHNRGVYKEMRYLSDRVILDYECPLAQIIVNFYDKLKSATQGYASMNYELIDYRKEDLVKMDVLVAGEKIDVLEQVVHKTEVITKAHDIVKKLKTLIPRQWFDVTIQAAIGGSSTSLGPGKILARENIAAMKKDVTGYLYGGDVSRKKKLWAKQARGKKRMKKLGKVDIPTDVFINLLKQ